MFKKEYFMNSENNEPIKEQDGNGGGLILVLLVFIGIIIALFFVLKSKPDLTEKPRMEAAPTLEELSEKDGVTIIENGDGTYTVIDEKEGTTSIIDPEVEDPSRFEVVRNIYNIERSVYEYLPTSTSLWYHESSEQNSLQNMQIVTQMLFSSDVLDQSHFDEIVGIANTTNEDGAYINILIEMKDSNQTEVFVEKIKDHINPSAWNWRGDYDYYKNIDKSDISIVSKDKYIYIVYVGDDLRAKHLFPTQEELIDAFYTYFE